MKYVNWDLVKLGVFLFLASLAGSSVYGVIKPMPDINIAVSSPINPECAVNDEAVADLSSTVYFMHAEIQRLNEVIATAKRLGASL